MSYVCFARFLFTGLEWRQYSTYCVLYYCITRYVASATYCIMTAVNFLDLIFSTHTRCTVCVTIF